MYNKKESQKQVSLLMAAIVASILIILLGLYEFSNLRERIETVILPNINTKINDIAVDTKIHIEYIQFNTASNYKNNHDNSGLMTGNFETCLNQISPSGKGQEFGINRKDDYYGSSKKNGLLIGVGDYQYYPAQELVRLCTLISAAVDNSELIRLTETSPLLDSTFYYASKRQNYILFLNTYFSVEMMKNYPNPFVKEDFSRIRNRSKNFWISRSHLSRFTGIYSMSFVRNIRDKNNNVIGFIARDIGVQDITDYFKTKFYNHKDGLNLPNYGNIKIYNHQAEIYNSDASHDMLNIESKSTVNADSTNNIVIESAGSAAPLTPFGDVRSSFTISYSQFVLMVFVENKHLIALLGLLFVFFYIVFAQLIKGIREGDKQYFDIMTEVYNRTGLQDKVIKKIKKELANGKSAHLFMIDANRFKSINDKHGHDVGDRAIKMISSAIRKINKTVDDIVRLGGDEFLIVLYIKKEMEFDETAYINKLNDKIAYDCRVEGLPTFTLSCGYEKLTDECPYSIDVAIKKADERLVAKKWIDKIDDIISELQRHNLNLPEESLELRLNMNQPLEFIKAERQLQKEISSEMLMSYQQDLNYLMSNYFQLLYPLEYSEQNSEHLHKFRMKIVEAHAKYDVSIAVFYFLFTKYQSFLFNNVVLTDEERVIKHRIMGYEIHFISSLSHR